MSGEVVWAFALPLLGLFALFVVAGRFDKVHGGTWDAGFRFAWLMAKVIAPFAALGLVIRLTQQ